ncbi:hypothetical protein [Pseudomonas juntendi]|uniref:hypothetical protein n=1 Tax=Pseudomonas juntendi TaxID=2666183 RepID=UPI002A06B028|nr:hypothetical protein [Pseudomonas putida]
MSICLALSDADWTLTKDIFSIVGTVATVVGVALASYVGLGGLSTWKKQLSGTSNHELARRVLVLAYKYRDAVDRVRNPWISPKEMELDNTLENGETSQERRYAGTCIAYDKRFLLVTESRRELDVTLLEAEALWGAEIKELVKPLYDKSWKLYAYIETYMMSIDPGQDDAYRQEYAEIVRSQPNIRNRKDRADQDTFAIEFNQLLNNVERYLRSKLA